ncbi:MULTISPECIES: hypothetical protein [Neorhizobium]|jgi:hypothetical protein|uniref:hypothetical protein n=1 Tax=Neorhizobium sp. T6_25 TaxID=2093833 RepID=UPI001FDF1FAA|nr:MULTISPECIES: hypothetical protein [Neorhizobium]
MPAAALIAYLTYAAGTVMDFKERGQRELAWLSPSEAARRVRGLELKSMLVEFPSLARVLVGWPSKVPFAQPLNEA